MNTPQQLSLWETTDTHSETLVWKEVTDLKEKQNNLRRGLFQRYDIMKKEIGALKEELTLLKSNMLIKEKEVM